MRIFWYSTCTGVRGRLFECAKCESRMISITWHDNPWNSTTCQGMTCHQMSWDDVILHGHDVMLRDWELVWYDFEETAWLHACFINSWIILFCGSNLVWCKNTHDVVRVVLDAQNECRILPCGRVLVCILHIFQSTMYMNQKICVCNAFGCMFKNVSNRPLEHTPDLSGFFHLVVLGCVGYVSKECWNCISSY